AQIALVLTLVFVTAVPLGRYIASVLAGRFAPLSPIERGFYAASGIDPQRGMTWKTYAVALVMLQAVHFVLLYLMLRFQDLLPLNPQGQTGLTPRLAFNTAI